MLLFDYFIIAGVAQSILLVFIIFSMKRNRKANAFYAVFIVIISCLFVHPLLRHGAGPLADYLFNLVLVSGIAVSGSMIYFYSGFIKIRVKSLVHFLPSPLISPIFPL